MNPELRKIFKQLMGEGWEVKMGKRHYKLKSPMGSTITVSATSSCRYAMANFLGDVKRAKKADEEKRRAA